MELEKKPENYDPRAIKFSFEQMAEVFEEGLNKRARIEFLEAALRAEHEAGDKLLISGLNLYKILMDIVTGDPITPEIFTRVSIDANKFSEAVAAYKSRRGKEGG